MFDKRFKLSPELSSWRFRSVVRRTQTTVKSVSRTPEKLVAISYARVSTGKQSEEDRSGLERQERAIAAWLQAHPEYELDREITAVGSGAKAGRFEWFIEELQQGRLPRDTCLVVEKMSRLGREELDDTFETLIRIFKAGGALAVCSLAGGQVLRSLSNQQGAVHALAGAIEAARFEWEERRDRALGSIASKRRRIAEGEKPFQARDKGKRTDYPFWLDFDPKESRFRLNNHAEWVKEAFLMAQEIGSTTIAKRLSNKGFKTATSKSITGSYIYKTLRNRAVLGERQPLDAKSRPIGDPIAGVYPPVVTEEEWRLARHAVERRYRGNVSTGSKRHNLFEGRIFCGSCGGRLGLYGGKRQLADGSEKFFPYLRCMTRERDPDACNARWKPYDEARLLSRIQTFRWADYFRDESHQADLADARKRLLRSQEDRAAAEREVQNLRDAVRQLLRDGKGAIAALGEEELQKALKAQEEAQGAESSAVTALETLGRRRTGKDAQRAIQGRVEAFMASERADLDARFEFNRWLYRESLVVVFDLERDQIELGTGEPIDGRLVELDQRLEDLAGLGASPAVLREFRKQLP